MWTKENNCQKIEDALIRVLDELTRYLIENKYEVMITNTSYNKDIDKIENGIIEFQVGGIYIIIDNSNNIYLESQSVNSGQNYALNHHKFVAIE